MSEGNLYYLAINHKFIDAIEQYPDKKEEILSLIFRYGNIEHLESLYNKHLKTDKVLNWKAIKDSLSHPSNIEFAIKNNLVGDYDMYNIFRFNYNYMKYAKGYDINFARLIECSVVGFKVLVDEFLKIGYTYDDIIKARHKSYSTLASLLYKHKRISVQEVIEFMNVLYTKDINMLLNFLRIDDEITILSINLYDNELYKKIMKYIEGRKLGKDLLEYDVKLTNILNI